jgi:NAD(P)H-dependent flavin oxidoreductase YrpB (nitropropane dioxygenase family)
MSETLSTPITKLFGIKYPILLAGMNVAAGPALAAAVTNAGGLGVIGGVGYTPDFLKKQVEFLKADLVDKSAPFGIDLLLPQVGGNARKTNKDYTEGNLPDLIEIICKSGAKLFVSAVGVPPRWATDKLHAHGIYVMNMIGAPKHVQKALDAGVDIICAQGGEGGGHTGDVATSVLIPLVVDLCRGKKSPMNGQPILVVAAGGIFDGRGLAMALALGAEAVWVGTRFVAAEEAGASKYHKDLVVKASVHDTIRTVMYTGRPMRIFKTDFTSDWEENRQPEIKKLTSQGTVPIEHVQDLIKQGKLPMPDTNTAVAMRPWLMGQAAGAINEVKPAKAIIDEMVATAVAIIRQNNKKIQPLAKL